MKLAFAGRPFARRDIDNFIFPFFRGPKRSADRLQVLRTGRARLRHDTRRLPPVVCRHGKPSAARPPLPVHRFKKHFFDRVAELERKAKVAIVGICPVVPRLQRQGHSDLRNLVSGASDVEEELPLLQEDEHLGIEKAGCDHISVGGMEELDRKPGQRARQSRVRDCGTGGSGARRRSCREGHACFLMHWYHTMHTLVRLLRCRRGTPTSIAAASTMIPLSPRDYMLIASPEAAAAASMIPSLNVGCG